MIIEAPYSYIGYVERSANYLNCPTHIFNEDLNATYRQFLDKGKGIIQLRIADVLHTFGYHTSKAMRVALELTEFYFNKPHKKFLKLNVNKYLDNLPKHIIAKDKEISAYIKKGTQYYHPMFGRGGSDENISFTPSYPFAKGYKLKLL